MFGVLKELKLKEVLCPKTHPIISQTSGEHVREQQRQKQLVRKGRDLQTDYPEGVREKRRRSFLADRRMRDPGGAC